MTTAIFETPRLLVRPWTHSESDEERLFDTYSRWEVARWLGSVPKPLASREEAAGVVDRWAARASGPYGIWAVELREQGTVAGTVLLVPLPNGDGEVEVGWHFHPDSWGHGYATEAAIGALTHGFAHGLDEIYAVVRPENEASLRVCRRLGMTPLGRTDRWYGLEVEAYRVTPDGLGEE